MAATNGINGAQHPDGLDDELPVELSTVDTQLPFAMKAVVVHQPEDWPTGKVCRNDHRPWPCQLYHWGHQVLWLAGWREAEIAGLVCRVEAGDLPWA
jgi:hypothetical protein